MASSPCIDFVSAFLRASQSELCANFPSPLWLTTVPGSARFQSCSLDSSFPALPELYFLSTNFTPKLKMKFKD